MRLGQPQDSAHRVTFFLSHLCHCLNYHALLPWNHNFPCLDLHVSPPLTSDGCLPPALADLLALNPADRFPPAPTGSLGLISDSMMSLLPSPSHRDILPSAGETLHIFYRLHSCPTGRAGSRQLIQDVGGGWWRGGSPPKGLPCQALHLPLISSLDP